MLKSSRGFSHVNVISEINVSEMCILIIGVDVKIDVGPDDGEGDPRNVGLWHDIDTVDRPRFKHA
jgi:hypothetical protein